MKGPLNISAITRQVASMRGRASRRIVRERIKRLRDQGVLLRTDGKTSTYDLVNKVEEQKRL
jgi:DNA-binding Lrp family transcriptional regulator